MQILLMSFGFKYGLPMNADFIFDVRCLPNPYWQPDLRALTGLDAAVIQYLKAIPEVQQMVTDIYCFIETWIPRFEADNRSQLTIAIGCTGGQHRSVYIVESITKKMLEKIPNVKTHYRELETART